MGQGARTVLAQIAAEVLSVPLARVTVVQPDTAITPYDQTTSSSRSTAMTGRAVQDAAEDVREQLLHDRGVEPRRRRARARAWRTAPWWRRRTRLTYPQALASSASA